MTAQSGYEIDVFSRMFGISKDHFLKYGLLRNELLCSYDGPLRNEIKEKLGIKGDKKVILYKQDKGIITTTE